LRYDGVTDGKYSTIVVPASELALGRDAAAMCLDEMFDDGQTEPCAAFLP